MFRVDTAAGQEEGERKIMEEWKGVKSNRAEQGKADTELRGVGGEGEGEMEAGREAEKKKEVGGREWTPRKCEAHTGKGRRWITSEELQNSKTNSNQEECFYSHLIYGRTRVWGARPCVTTSTIWIYLLCLAFQEAKRLEVGVQE